MPAIPAPREAETRESQVQGTTKRVQGQPRQLIDSLCLKLKVRQSGGRGYSSVVERFPNVHKALSSIT